MNPKKIAIILGLLLTLTLAACGGATPEITDSPPAPAATDSPVPEPAGEDPTAPPPTVGPTEAGTTPTAEPTQTPQRQPAQFEQDRLVLAFIPQENPEKLLGDIDVITDYLSEELGIPVEGFVTQDHAAAVEALRNEDADISFMGALPYVLAHDQVGAEVILSEVYRGSSIYHGRIFVRKDSGIETLEDLRGKSIAFADPISESGYLYPLDIFVQEGLMERDDDPNTFFSTVYFAGGYQQAIQAVVNGYVDAAGASQFADLLIPPAELDEVAWIAESDPIPSHAVIVRPDLDPALVERFISVMLKLNEPEYQHLLEHVYGPDGYVRATHEDYEGVEEIARLYGYLEN